MTWREIGEDENTKTWISQEWKEFSRWSKNIFHNLWRAIIWLKIEISSKIADKSFKESNILKFEDKILINSIHERIN